MRVLVTRPEPGAGRTADKLRAMGHEAVVLPLTEIVTLTPDWPAGRFDAVLATSANAFLSATTLPEQWRGLPLHVVGEQTASVARSSGFQRIGTVAADVSGLLATLSGSCARGSRLIYLCGKVRRPDLEKGLEARGHFLVPVEAYDTIPVSYMTDNLLGITASGSFDAVLVMSGEAGLALMPYLRDQDLSQLFDNTHFYCISGRVAEGLEPLAPGRVFVSETPDEGGILRLIQSLSAH